MDYNLDGDDYFALVEGESPGDCWVKVLKHYKGRSGMMIYIRNIQETTGPIFFMQQQNRRPFRFVEMKGSADD